MMMIIIIIAVNDRFVVFVQQVLFTLFRIGGLFGVLLYRLWRKISGSRVVGVGWGAGPVTVKHRRPYTIAVITDRIVCIVDAVWRDCRTFKRRFPEITGEDNLTVFSYSGRVKSPEWRRQRRRASLRKFQIFRHRPVVIYTRLPAGGTYYPICMFPTNGECLIGISDAFFAFCLRVSVVFPTCSLYPHQKRAYSALHLYI